MTTENQPIWEVLQEGDRVYDCDIPSFGIGVVIRFHPSEILIDYSNHGKTKYDWDYRFGLFKFQDQLAGNGKDKNLIQRDIFQPIATAKKSSRGGKRSGAGRKASGTPPKKRKAIQLDQDVAARLPNLKMLADLLDEFRPNSESIPLRSTKLAEFYKKLDALPYIC